MKIFLCEDSFEGILTGVYDAWNSRLGHNNVKLQIEGQFTFELFAEYETVSIDLLKSQKVISSIKNKISPAAYEMVFRAALSFSPEKADCIYRFLILGFHMGKDVIDHHTDDFVRRIFELNREVGNETHLLTGFLRFIELKNSVLFSKIDPKNDVLILLAPHFQDRFPNENWIIYDEKRNKAAIHKIKMPFYIALDTDMLSDIQSLQSEKEEHFQNMWKVFFDTIAIKERINPKLQTQLARKRFRSNMTEFK